METHWLDTRFWVQCVISPRCCRALGADLGSETSSHFPRAVSRAVTAPARDTPARPKGWSSTRMQHLALQGQSWGGRRVLGARRSPQGDIWSEKCLKTALSSFQRLPGTPPGSVWSRGSRGQSQGGDRVTGTLQEGLGGTRAPSLPPRDITDSLGPGVYWE